MFALAAQVAVYPSASRRNNRQNLMKMAAHHERSQSGRRFGASEMKMVMVIVVVITPFLLLDISLGQDLQSCGTDSGYSCPNGLCCSIYNYCGNTSAYCGAGNCSSQCNSTGESESFCGPDYGNVACANGGCCSTHGYCGRYSSWCGVGNCSTQCPLGTCGTVGGSCSAGACCNIYGYCGYGDGYCNTAYCSSQCFQAPAQAPYLHHPFRKHKKAPVMGIAIGAAAFVTICVIGLAFIFWRKNGRAGLFTQLSEDPTLELEGMPERFSFMQLSRATKAFSEDAKLGQGGFGSVYRGVLKSGIQVAVKKISGDSSQGEKEFMAEVSIVSRLRHRNLIQILGWCTDVAKGKYLLVYELMPNGSLDKMLFTSAGADSIKAPFLTWPQRFNIATGTAAALEYLHQGWNQQVIHRDIKSSNIMLDEGWNAKLGDFGLARLVDHQRTGATTGLAGTYGYLAPEVATSGRFTDKTDVFAFGAVLLEIACGRKAFSTEFPPEQTFLVTWVWKCLSEGALMSTVDKRLLDFDQHWMEVLLIMGLLCSHPDPMARPSMRHMVEVLAGHVPVPSVPTSKPAPVYSSSYSFSLRGISDSTTITSESEGNRPKPLETESSSAPTMVSSDNSIVEGR